MNLANLNWPIILIIIALSAVVSYVGDVLGMKIGKKRISIFGLRPRYTSTVITLITGVGVAVVTILVASYASDTVRGVFVRNYLDRQIRSMSAELSGQQSELQEMTLDLIGARQELASLREERIAMQNAVEELRAETEGLKQGLAEMKEGRVVASQGELLAQTSVEGPVSQELAESALTRLIQTAEESLSLKLQRIGETGAALSVVVTDEEKEKVVQGLSATRGRRVLRMTAPANVVAGQTVEGVVNVIDSKVIFQEGEILMSNTVRGGIGQDHAADLLYTLLKQINRKAVASGVLPDPISGAVGNLDTLEFYEVVDRISEAEGEITIEFLAASDIYTEGPVNIRIETRK